ncbi:MAG TPA: cupin domain-containing protein [Dermatophilaceae bacterium]|nr:cupin domain-containing protein [Dermatophilaceae bacterium]
MPHVITDPIRIPVPGGKLIDEHVGLASTQTAEVSVAHMVAPPGWEEPYQTPEFDEITVVVKGTVHVDSDGVRHEVRAGQSVITKAGERVRYSVGPQGAEYVAVCLPAFTPDAAHRED